MFSSFCRFVTSVLSESTGKLRFPHSTCALVRVRPLLSGLPTARKALCGRRLVLALLMQSLPKFYNTHALATAKVYRDAGMLESAGFRVMGSPRFELACSVPFVLWRLVPPRTAAKLHALATPRCVHLPPTNASCTAFEASPRGFHPILHACAALKLACHGVVRLASIS